MTWLKEMFNSKKSWVLLMVLIVSVGSLTYILFQEEEIDPALITVLSPSDSVQFTNSEIDIRVKVEKEGLEAINVSATIEKSNEIVLGPFLLSHSYNYLTWEAEVDLSLIPSGSYILHLLVYYDDLSTEEKTSLFYYYPVHTFSASSDDIYYQSDSVQTDSSIEATVVVNHDPELQNRYLDLVLPDEFDDADDYTIVRDNQNIKPYTQTPSAKTSWIFDSYQEQDLCYFSIETPEMIEFEENAVRNSSSQLYQYSGDFVFQSQHSFTNVSFLRKLQYISDSEHSWILQIRFGNTFIDVDSSIYQFSVDFDYSTQKFIAQFTIPVMVRGDTYEFRIVGMENPNDKNSAEEYIYAIAVAGLAFIISNMVFAFESETMPDGQKSLNQRFGKGKATIFKIVVIVGSYFVFVIIWNIMGR